MHQEYLPEKLYKNINNGNYKNISIYIVSELIHKNIVIEKQIRCNGKCKVVLSYFNFNNTK